MALIPCSECGKPVSDKANACPSCGNPLSGSEAKINTASLFEKRIKEYRDNGFYLRKRSGHTVQMVHKGSSVIAMIVSLCILIPYFILSLSLLGKFNIVEFLIAVAGAAAAGMIIINNGAVTISISDSGKLIETGKKALKQNT